MKTPYIPKTHNGIPFSHLIPAKIDFEYNQSKEERMNIICCSIETEGNVHEFWVDHNESGTKELKKFLKERKLTHIWLSYNAVAEAASFISIGINPINYAWIDLQLEYKMLLNHWDKFRYGQQLLNGKEVTTKRPKSKWLQTEEERKATNSSKPETNLAACCYKLLGKKIDTQHKNEMRDLIINNPKGRAFTDKEKQYIQAYCTSDIIYLGNIFEKIRAIYNGEDNLKGKITWPHMAWRGNCAARTAYMTQLGYPVDTKKVTNFSNSVRSILDDIAIDINEQFPDMGVFQYNKSQNKYSKREAPQREWVKKSKYADRWRKTDTGKPSLSLDAFTDHFNFRHEYPEGNFPAQMIRYLKTKQSMNGFMPVAPGKKRKSFFDSLGSDGKVRAWLNPYGSQSSRFQPSASGFIPLKAAWMRSLIVPPSGYGMVGIDYSSEEILITALVAKDKDMYEAYVSGDPYYHFAKLAKAVPMDSTKKDNPVIRDKFKSTMLGINFGMAKVGLAKKLTEDTGVETSEEEAQKLIDMFYNAFPAYKEWRVSKLNDYRDRGYLYLPDGWIMFGDNDNDRSVLNCPIQGFGACILRRAIYEAQEKNIKVNIPLHDALYAQFPSKKLDKVDDLYDVMISSFTHYFQYDEEVYEWSKAIRLDVDVWGSDFKEGVGITPRGREFKSQKIYIDPRSAREYERFKKYF